MDIIVETTTVNVAVSYVTIITITTTYNTIIVYYNASPKKEYLTVRVNIIDEATTIKVAGSCGMTIANNSNIQ